MISSIFIERGEAMKTFLKFLKIVILTIITGGLYGAYWTFMALTKDENDIDDTGEVARGNQIAAFLTWFRPYQR